MELRANRRVWEVLFCVGAALTLHGIAVGAADTDSAAQAKRIVDMSGVRGGLIVHVGCGDGHLTASLALNDRYRVHGLDTDEADVDAARQNIKSRRIYGRVSVDEWEGKSLPYRTDLVNLVVCERGKAVSMDEVMRVLQPNGVAMLRRDGQWTKKVKPRPDELDEWTHYLHDASGNPVSQDTRVGPPQGLQWVGGPRWGRHHDHMASMNALVSGNGRIFYVIDKGSRKSILLPARWYLVARDAFNGTILWERRLSGWHTPLWPLKSGPAQLPRRLVAMGDRLYAMLGQEGPVSVLDAATGEVVHTYPGTKGATEIILSDGVLYALVDAAAGEGDPEAVRDVQHRARNTPWWTREESRIMAFRTDNGKLMWEKSQKVVPLTLAAEDGRLCCHNGQKLVCLDAANGSELWTSRPIAIGAQIYSFFGPTLVIDKGTVLFAGGEKAAMQFHEDGVMMAEDNMTAVSLEDGKTLWEASHPASGYRSPEDIFVLGDRVWCGETNQGRLVGIFTGRDIRTGKVEKEFPPDVETHWFHHRCYRGKATSRYLMMSRTGIEYIDPETEHWEINHWTRGSCLYGVMPANGLTYAGPHDCACYIVAKTSGFNALSPDPAAPLDELENISDADRLTKGPAYDRPVEMSAKEGDWPTYRCDGGRSGHTALPVSAKLESSWEADVGDDLTSPVVAGGRLFISGKATHTVYCLDASTGESLWDFTAGGRVDSPPTISEGRVVFGCRDGRVYCLRFSDGALIWKFRVAPLDLRTMAYEDLESVWPVHGSVLVRDGQAWCVAGRSMFMDGGLRLVRLDVKTGKKLFENVMDRTDPTTGRSLQEKIKGLNMPPALPDILSSKGDRVYMRTQEFDRKGRRTEVRRPENERDQLGEAAHLLAATGFLDDAWFHRSYWFYGKTPLSGAGGYYRAGRNAPAGRIMVFDESTVYGYGRKPKYLRWTTPIEYELFASTRQDFQRGSGWIDVEKTPSLDPAGVPISIEAWINPRGRNGVVAARGAGVQGFTLYLKRGRPHFGIVISKSYHEVRAKKRVPNGKWTHIAGVLTADKKLEVYVNGKLSNTSQAPGFIASTPGQAMEVGADEGGQVGNYDDVSTFHGLIDELKLYRGALSAEAVKSSAAGERLRAPEDVDLVLYYSFDAGDAKDTSGKGNHGEVGEVDFVSGKFGRAAEFGSRGLPDFYRVRRQWTREIPLHARAMALAHDTLFAAGPPDLVDEEKATRSIGRPETMQKLRHQDAAWQGAEGALLWATSKKTGDKLAEYRLEALPVWDGMAAANGCLYIATTDGKVHCLKGEK